MNVFQLNYDTRLKSWYDLRTSLVEADTQTKCIEVDKWWQRAPLVTHYLHPIDLQAWPGPWDLLNDNEYCQLARGLGIIYTLLLLGVDDIDFCLGTDDNSEDVALVLVDNAKYVMNYWPDMVVNINLQEFKFTDTLDLQELKKKI
jgi:hypothetical protein